MSILFLAHWTSFLSVIGMLWLHVTDNRNSPLPPSSIFHFGLFSFTHTFSSSFPFVPLWSFTLPNLYHPMFAENGKESFTLLFLFFSCFFPHLGDPSTSPFPKFYTFIKSRLEYYCFHEVSLAAWELLFALRAGDFVAIFSLFHSTWYILFCNIEI